MTVPSPSTPARLQTLLSLLPLTSLLPCRNAPLPTTQNRLLPLQRAYDPHPHPTPPIKAPDHTILYPELFINYSPPQLFPTRADLVLCVAISRQSALRANMSSASGEKNTYTIF